MKKLALSLAVLFAVGMVSCGGNKENKEACEDSTPVEVVEEGVVEVAADSANQTDTTVAAAAAATETPAEAAPAEAAPAN